MARRQVAKQTPTPAVAHGRATTFAGLIAWYRRNRRHLPWRSTRDAYAVWVSEVMLQQTTTRTALRYYTPFLDRFPTVEALAHASEETVLAAWSGLGYYHRARNLHRGARCVLERHTGSFPRELRAALAVPGVGLYTASAVLSIAYDAPLAVVDGNVRRVFSRVFALRGREWQRDSAFYNLAAELLDRDAPGDWNQALMELGATVCTPVGPACPVCPIASRCEARRLDLQAELPEGRVLRRAVSVTVAAALIRSGSRVLLVRRPESPVLSRFWEIPQTGLDADDEKDLRRALAVRHSLDVAVGPLLSVVRHAITFRRIRVEVYGAELAGTPTLDTERTRWAASDELNALALSSMTRKILASVQRRQLPLPLS
jgi:A/G-specific adenine glycosylase